MKQTAWCVITGAPCSGKTSVIRELHARGERVIGEAARSLINQELAGGRSLKEIKADILTFERRILHRKFDIETALPPNEIIFLDRAVPDSIAYFMFEGLDPTEPLKLSRLFRYRRIFLFERLAMESDPVRLEDEIAATRIERLLENAYQNLGYEVRRIPVLSVEDRIDFINRYL